MLETTKHNYKVISIFTSTLAAGIPIWTSSARQIDLTDISFLTTWLLFGVFVSFVTQFIVNLNIRDFIGSFAIGYVTAVVIHFVGTLLLTNYIQSRFELTLVIALGSGIFTGAAGSLLWKGIKRKGKKKKK